MTFLFPTAEEVALHAAAAIVTHRARALADRGHFTFAVSGGRTPVLLLRALAHLDWSRCTLLLADERCVPPDHPESNLRLVAETLGEGARSAIVPLPWEDQPLEPLEPLYQDLDVLVLGIGEDGHFASIFPGSPLLFEQDARLARVVDSPKPPLRRVTLTPRVVREAREVFVLATGAGKSLASARALTAKPGDADPPAALLRGATWWLDEPAAYDLLTISTRGDMT